MNKLRPWVSVNVIRKSLSSCVQNEDAVWDWNFFEKFASVRPVAIFNQKNLISFEMFTRNEFGKFENSCQNWTFLNKMCQISLRRWTTYCSIVSICILFPLSFLFLLFFFISTYDARWALMHVQRTPDILINTISFLYLRRTKRLYTFTYHNVTAVYADPRCWRQIFFFSLSTQVESLS